MGKFQDLLCSPAFRIFVNSSEYKFHLGGCQTRPTLPLACSNLPNTSPSPVVHKNMLIKKSKIKQNKRSIHITRHPCFDTVYVLILTKDMII